MLYPTLFAFFVLISPAFADKSYIVVENPCITKPIIPMRPTSGYMTIKISNGQKLSLVQASVTKVVDQKENEIDKKNISIELHSHQFIEDRVEMKKVQTLDPDEQGVIELKRGGNHLMIYHLPRKELKFLYIQLTFRDPKGYESHEIICFPVRPIDSIECCSNGNAK